jgi:hypothetical protein
MLLSACDQVIKTNTVQKAAHKLKQTVTERGLTVCAQHRNWWHIKDKVQLQVKFLTDKITEQVHYLHYLGNLIYYKKRNGQ